MFTLNGEELDVPEEICGRLFAHQKEGVQWLLNLHASPYPGGILGQPDNAYMRLLAVTVFRRRYGAREDFSSVRTPHLSDEEPTDSTSTDSLSCLCAS